MALGGAVPVLFGIVIALFPSAGALAVVWLIGAYAIIFGFLMLFLSFRLRCLAGGRQPPMMGTPA